MIILSPLPQETVRTTNLSFYNEMAEFLTQSEADSKYASKGTGNAGLTLGIIGTALASGIFNRCGGGGLFGGSGILGLGGGCGCGNGIDAGMGMAATAAAAHELGGVARKETLDQEYDLIEMGKIKEKYLRDMSFIRERDIAEKADIYRQTKADNNRLEDKIGNLKEFTTTGLADVYRSNYRDFRELEKTVGENKLASYKDMSDLYRASVVADKNLEIQIERNREIDQHEKFGLYKDLQEKTSTLAYDAMKQSYEDRIATMQQMGALNARISALEKSEAVTSAKLPLMFRISEADAKADLQRAVCHKIDGSLKLDPYQINYPPVFTGNINNNGTCCG